ncbi:hypothetical protein CHUAL_013800 [Chamberlinius hualienensis]
MITIIETDSRVEEWAFMSSVIPLLSLLTCYAGMIHYGRKWMKNKNSFNIDGIMVVYDASMVVLNLYITCQFLIGVIRLKYNWVCEPIHYNGLDEEEMRIVKTFHLYFLCKVFELIDTLTFIVRKKGHQLLAVHYFHHISMVIISYIGARWTPGGNFFVYAMVNSMVHFCLYLNHALFLLKSTFIQSNWWKKYLFIIKTGQLSCLLFGTILGLLTGCRTPFYHNYVLMGHALLLSTIHICNILRGNGSIVKLSDIMRYDDKVNSD